MPGPHRSASTQFHNQQVLAKLQHQPSERDQQAREKLRQKAKIKSRAYIQLGEKALQTVHQTFTPDIPVFLHLEFQVQLIMIMIEMTMTVIKCPMTMIKCPMTMTMIKCPMNMPMIMIWP